ncbi:MAG: hypothetical protein WD069_19850 [Planctomycetales bacterium]
MESATVETMANIGPKTHPAAREMLPEDPLEMQAFEVPGDPELMLRLLVEEYARIGHGADILLELARDPNYVALHGLRRTFGEEGLRQRVQRIVAQCGVLRVRMTEAERPPDQLVQLE